MSQANAPIAKKLNVPRNMRLRTYYDTKAIVQNTSSYNFFPANASRVDTDNNYVTNPLPGNKDVAILGMSIDTTIQIIKTAANVDPVKIINALKYASVKVELDQDNKQMLLGRLGDFFNFKSTAYHSAASEGAASAQVLTEAIEMRSNGVIRFADPFQVGAGQVFNVTVRFADSSVFPTEAHWGTAGYGALKLVASLFVAEPN
jgi:hypothetical protein